MRDDDPSAPAESAEVGVSAGLGRFIRVDTSKTEGAGMGVGAIDSVTAAVCDSSTGLDCVAACVAMSCEWPT